MTSTIPPTDYLRRLAKLEPWRSIQLVGDDYIGLRPGLYATLYFLKPDVNPYDPTSVKATLSMRQALLACYEDFIATCERQMQWIQLPVSGPMKLVRRNDRRVVRPEQFFSEDKYALSWTCLAHSGNHKWDASEAMFKVFASGLMTSGFQYNISSLRLQLPFDWVAAGQTHTFVSLVRRCAERLPTFISGHGGLGMLTTPNVGNSVEEAQTEFSRHFNGVDVDVPLHNAEDMERWGGGIHGMHWINLLGRYWVDTWLGGLDTLKAQFPTREGYRVVPMSNKGVLLQAGPLPEPAAKEDELPPHVVAMNRVLRKIRCPDISYHIGPWGDPFTKLCGRAQSMVYYTRFDDPQPEDQPIFAQNKEPCPCTGVWTGVDHETRHVFFDAGQTMPRIREHPTLQWRLIRSDDPSHYARPEIKVDTSLPPYPLPWSLEEF